MRRARVLAIHNLVEVLGVSNICRFHNGFAVNNNFSQFCHSREPIGTPMRSESANFFAFFWCYDGSQPMYEKELDTTPCPTFKSAMRDDLIKKPEGYYGQHQRVHQAC